MDNYGKELIQSAVREVDRKFIENKYEFNRELNNALRNKYNKVEKDEEKYIELLKFNVIYYKAIIKKLETIIEMWIQNGVISSTESVDKSIENITRSSRKYVNEAMKGGTQHLNDKDKEIFFSYDNSSGLERIEKVENDYKILNIYKDMLGMVIAEISSNVDKYKVILDMNLAEVKIDTMDEIFKMVNEILFSEDPSKSEFEDEALVGEEEITTRNVEDSDKCTSFKKYVSMISTPEISVKINDMFRRSNDLEGIEEDEDSYLFSVEMKDYVSCMVLLQDYLPEDNRSFIKNIFRAFVIGKISEEQFRELCDKFIREHTFLDKRTWLECQKNVKSDFNMENNNFFGEKILDHNAEDLSNDEMMDLLIHLEEDVSIEEGIEYAIEDSFARQDEENITGFAQKLKQGISSISDKLKMNEDHGHEEYDEYEDDYDEEFYDDEFEDDIDDYNEEYDGKESFTSKIKNLFSKHKYEDDEEYEDDYYDEDEDDFDDSEDYDLDPEMFTGDESIQDEGAIEILKMREKSKRRDDERVKKEFNKLQSERQLAEEINKNGSMSFVDDEDIIFDENDYIYKKNKERKKNSLDKRNKDLFDHTINGEISIEEVNDSQQTGKEKADLEEPLTPVEIEEYNKEEKNEFKPILGETQRLHTGNIRRSDDKTTVIELGTLDSIKEKEKKHPHIKDEIQKIDRNKKVYSYEESLPSKEKSGEDEDNSKNKVVKKKETDLKKIDDGHVFEELEAMKAMNFKDISVTPTDSNKGEKVDLSSFGKNKNKSIKKTANEKIVKKSDKQKDQEDTKKENKQPIKNKENNKTRDNKSSLKNKIGNIGKGIVGDDTSETVMFSKKKIVRDTIIVVAIVVLVFFSYVFIIKGFKVPTVEETNNNTKITQKAKNEENADSSNKDLNKDTKDIAQKTEKEKEKDEIETKAGELDREAEKYKGQKGVYYTVFIGATKDKDGAESVAYNFAQKGIDSKVVRNGGYYMLKVGEYFDYNQAHYQSQKISSKGVQNYIASQNKYYDLKIEAYQTRIPNLSADQLKTDYEDIKNQISSTGKNSQYVTNLDEIYSEAIKEKQ
ncbi:MAG: sporulation and cell division repeat protein [Peptostreptococcus sp.]